MSEVIYAVEGATDVPVAEKLVRMVGRIPRRGPIPAGKGRLDINLPRWNVPSNRQPFLVLRDWDANDGVACVPALLDKLRGEAAGSPGLAVRIAVRSVESWLLADSEAFSTFFRVRRDLLPTEPDEIADPKGVVLQLCSRSPSNIRRGMLPRSGSGRRVGPEYAAFVIEFGRQHWDPSRARGNSPSLNRSIARLEALIADQVW